MIIDLLPVINVQGERVTFDGDVVLDEDIKFSSPVNVRGFILNIGNTLEFHADIEAEMKCRCDRCGKDMTYEFSFNAVEELRKEDGSDLGEDFDGTYYTGNSIDVSDIICKFVFMNIPMKILCSDDCRGLCPHCGADLNTLLCGCKNDDRDPRLDVLNKLL